MLSNFTIKGFKSIKHTSIELGRVNLFIGGNGVGKSNVLEAIGVLSACLGRDITAGELQKKGVRLSVPTLFKSAFKNSTLRATFDLKAKFDDDTCYDVSIAAGKISEELQFHSEKLLYKDKKIMGRSNHGISVSGMQNEHLIKDFNKTRGIWDRYRDTVSFPEALNTNIDAISNYVIYSPQTAFLRGTDIESNLIKPMGLNGGGLANAVYTVLQDWRGIGKNESKKELYDRVFNLVWKPDWTNRFTVNVRNPDIVSSVVKTEERTLYFQDRFMHLSRNLISAYDSSEGTLYILFLVVLLLHSETPKIFALDNVDNSLNPSMTRHLIETIINVTCDDTYRKNNIGPQQILMTSHNPTALDALDLFNDDHRIFVVARDKSDGSTAITRLEPPRDVDRADWIAKAGGKNLSELWIEGKIKNALGI